MISIFIIIGLVGAYDKGNIDLHFFLVALGFTSLFGIIEGFIEYAICNKDIFKKY
jgi:hypothetical protein